MKLYIILFVAIIFCSCRKELIAEKCTQNCKTYNIKGKLYDGVSNAGFANKTIELKWSYFRYCIICPRSKQIYAGRSDANGNFNFTVNLDTTYFNNYSLQLSTPKINGYFELFPGSISREDLLNDSFVNIDYYPIANLKLNLRKTQTDSLENLRVTHLWKIPGTGDYIQRQDYFGQTPKIPRDTSLNIETVAGLSTKVILYILYANGTRTEISDSIVCNGNSTSTLTMNY